MKQLNLFSDQKEPEPAIYVVTWWERETCKDYWTQKLSLTGRIIRRGGRLRYTLAEAARLHNLLCSFRYLVKAPKIRKVIPQTIQNDAI